MKRFKNILLVADFESKQRAAVERAASLVRQNDARLSVISVVKEVLTNLQMAIVTMTPGELLDRLVAERRRRVDRLVEKLAQQGVEASAQVVTGTPFLEVIRQVRRDAHDLVIVAAEGKGGLESWLFGSTSMHLMRKCPCPVWVVKAGKRSGFKRVLAAVDTASLFPEQGRDSLNPLIVQLASSIAHMENSELNVVQVWSVFGEGHLGARGGLSESAIRKLRRRDKQAYASNLNALLAECDLDGLVVHKHLPRADDVPKAIVALAKKKRIDLLVMGTICRTGIAGFFIGNTAEKVLNAVDCSVLTVKPEGFVSPVA